MRTQFSLVEGGSGTHATAPVPEDKLSWACDECYKRGAAKQWQDVAWLIVSAVTLLISEMPRPHSVQEPEIILRASLLCLQDGRVTCSSDVCQSEGMWEAVRQ